MSSLALSVGLFYYGSQSLPHCATFEPLLLGSCGGLPRGLGQRCKTLRTYVFSYGFLSDFSLSIAHPDKQAAPSVADSHRCHVAAVIINLAS